MMSAIRTCIALFHDSISISCHHQQLFSDCILSHNFKPCQFPVCLDDQCYGFFQVFACFFQCPPLCICAGQFFDIADPPVSVSFEYCGLLCVLLRMISCRIPSVSVKVTSVIYGIVRGGGGAGVSWRWVKEFLGVEVCIYVSRCEYRLD